MVKAYSKFGARRASERDTRLKEVMVRQLTKESVKQNEQKKPLDNKKQKCHTFLQRWSHFDPNFGPFPEGAEARPLDQM
jgi:hypothetical protein